MSEPFWMNALRAAAAGPMRDSQVIPIVNEGTLGAVLNHIDALTAANEFARTEWAIWEEKACQLQARLDAVRMIAQDYATNRMSAHILAALGEP
jgi:hypothetical protein